MTNHETGHISDSLAGKVYWDNVRDNQIGGETDGISRAVAEDIGYKQPQSFEEPVLPTETESSDTDNIVGIEEVPATSEERAAARRTSGHPVLGRRLREMPRRGADNAPKEKFNPDQEHQDAAVIGLAAATEALRQRRGDQ